MRTTNITLDLNIGTIILIGVVVFLLIFGGFRMYNNKVDEFEEKVSAEIKLRNSLIDSIRFYQNKEKDWTAEKLTIQTSIKNLELLNKNLTENQKELLEKILLINKKNDIITAALIETQIKIDSLVHAGETIVDTTDNSVIFKDHFVDGNKELKYKLTVSNVKPIKVGLKPTLLLDSLYFPNKQFVEFHWKDDKKNGYPVSFTVTNSNEYFQTVNIDSYAIPNINKQDIKPTFGKKMKDFFKKSGDKVLWTGVGIGVGTLAVILLTGK